MQDFSSLQKNLNKYSIKSINTTIRNYKIIYKFSDIMKWISYQSPILYEFSLRMIHGKKLWRRYAYIAKNIKKGSSVLDIGCGTGILGRQLNKKCRYKGIDLNKSFINYALKKGLDVSVHDIFNFKSYLKKFNVIVVCDVLHHIYPKHKIFLENIKNYADKIILCEPYDISQAYENKGYIRFLEKMKTFLVILDSDGYNPLRLKFNKKWWYDKNSLKTFFKKSFKNRKSLTMKEVGRNIIAIYNFI